MTKIIHKHSSGGVLCKDGKVLVIHWDAPRNSFDFPKGTIEAGETSHEACVREVLEETGYETKIIAPLGQTHYEYDWTDGTHHKKTVDYYLLGFAHDIPVDPKREPHETFENAWLTFDKAAQQLTFDVDRDILQKALKQNLAF
ncbi:MAG: NUDIX domain-containing protein [Candidatus Saccharimonadales bacterium]